MNKTKSLVVLACLAMVFSGCMKISKKKSTTEENKPQQTFTSENNSDLDSKQLQYEINPEDIVFIFPTEWPEALFVEVVDQDQRTTIPLNFKTENKTWSFPWPGNDRKFGFTFKNGIDKGSTVLKAVEALPPLNISTEQSIDLFATYDLNTNVEKIVIQQLELFKGAQLFLKTFSGQVIINNLYSESGSIQTFPTNSRANNDMAGLHGGRVEFKILTGHGNLTLLALGQNGGDGSQGPAPDENLRGRRGDPGARGEFGERNDSMGNTLFTISNYPCVKDPTDSGAGHKGLQGYRGFPGQNGGNSGHYSIEKIPAELKVNVSAKEGRGGRGGVGGAGGEGGFGGEIYDGGLIDLFVTKYNYDSIKASEEKKRLQYLVKISPACKSASVGGQGPRGEPGEPGLPGEAGINEYLSKN